MSDLLRAVLALTDSVHQLARTVRESDRVDLLPIVIVLQIQSNELAARALVDQSQEVQS